MAVIVGASTSTITEYETDTDALFAAKSSAVAVAV
jgi:hypothetical protein